MSHNQRSVGCGKGETKARTISLSAWDGIREKYVEMGWDQRWATVFGHLVRSLERAMINLIRREYERIEDLPFPSLGKVVGDFPLYDSLLTGVAQSYISGQLVGFDVDDIPIPDDGTVKAVGELRRKPICTLEEQSFLEYFDALQSLQLLLQRALQQEGSVS